MKLLSTLFLLAFVGTAGAAVALAYSHPGNVTDDATGRICVVSGYTMYCN